MFKDPKTKLRKRIAFEILGCRLNAYETDALATKFKKNGYEIVEPNEEPSAIIVNTCTVTNQADRKSRNIISQSLRKIHKWGNNRFVVVTGCFVGGHKQELMGQDDALYIVENRQKSQIFDLVDAHIAGELPQLNEAEDNDVFDFVASDQIFHTRGMLKVQDGCNNFCSFCIIPFSRGAAISRPMPSILEDVKTMVLKNGFKEIVLTGVNMSYYTWETRTFSDLLEQILNLDLDFRLRLSSLEPHLLDEKFFKLMKHPKLCEHLHLCIQSGGNNVLRTMKRLYTYEEYRDIIFKIREHEPLFNITTDLIVGFPGESESDFNQSLNAIEELNFGHVHTFRYSKRDGTEAAAMMQQIPEVTKSLRSEKIRMLAEKKQKEFREQFVGKEVEVIIEENKNGFLWGTTRHFVPIILEFDGVNNIFMQNTLIRTVPHSLVFKDGKHCLQSNIINLGNKNVS